MRGDVHGDQVGTKPDATQARRTGPARHPIRRSRRYRPLRAPGECNNAEIGAQSGVSGRVPDNVDSGAGGLHRVQVVPQPTHVGVEQVVGGKRLGGGDDEQRAGDLLEDGDAVQLLHSLLQLHLAELREGGAQLGQAVAKPGAFLGQVTEILGRYAVPVEDDHAGAFRVPPPHKAATMPPSEVPTTGGLSNPSRSMSAFSRSSTLSHPYGPVMLNSTSSQGRLSLSTTANQSCGKPPAPCRATTGVIA